ncbi:MAG: hypothetical protein Q9222_000190 [Ikaeria aurantiellina]
MGTFLTFLCIYVVGGLTLIPLFIILVLILAYFTAPKTSTQFSTPSKYPDSLADSQDDGQNIKSAAALANLEEKFQHGHEADVAAGYFAVCREYVPGGVNGKPPERTTPAGSVVAAESPSVYQSMYRSIFDRKQGPTLDAGKGSAKPTKGARNVFFVVLRHGHLMLYDDAEQFEVRHVISLEHHNISIHGEDDSIPEGELWIKRNAIRLSRRSRTEDILSTSKPFYLFSENCSEKEDFYFALLQNQEVKPGDIDSPPRPQKFEAKDIISLVQQLHSSEEQLQTRWVNALISRLFLALYKTPQVEDFIRKKITKKIARVKKPAFLSSIVLRTIDMGKSAPYITNPRLKDLTIDGDCCVEANIRYRGSFRIEIATTARIDLGARFKIREVNLVLAAVVKKLEGHVLVKFKPPPSNRVWMSFETMPDMDLSIEPIVSSRQITYNVILKAIESRIREVIAETMVLPHWDDSPFLDTSHQQFRGGIWGQSSGIISPSRQHNEVPIEVPEDDADAASEQVTFPPSSPLAKDERSMSMPAISDPATPTVRPRKATTSNLENTVDGSPELPGGAISSGVQKAPPLPKAIRSRSFASAADPLVSMDQAKVASQRNEIKKAAHPDATSTMKAISHKSRPTSPNGTLTGSSPLDVTFSADIKHISDIKSDEAEQHSFDDRRKVLSSPPTPRSAQPMEPSSQGLREGKTPDHRSSEPPILHEKKQSIGSIGAATAAAAKSWGWNVLNRTKEYRQQHHVEGAGTPESPIGRGRPLPPLGQPLPLPGKSSTKVAQNGTTKRKPVALPVSNSRRQSEVSVRSEKAPPLPTRSRQPSTSIESKDQGHLLVVEMPSESPPGSPHGDEENRGISLPATEEKRGDDRAEAAMVPGSVGFPDPGASTSHVASLDTPNRENEDEFSSGLHQIQSGPMAVHSS